MKSGVAQGRLSEHQSHVDVAEVFDEDGTGRHRGEDGGHLTDVASGETARPKSTTGGCTTRVTVTAPEERRAPLGGSADWASIMRRSSLRIGRGGSVSCRRHRERCGLSTHRVAALQPAVCARRLQRCN